MRRVLLLLLLLPLVARAQVFVREPEEVAWGEDRIRIRWVTDQPVEARLQYGCTEALELGEQIVPASGTEVQVELQGLNPATIYWVAVALQGGARFGPWPVITASRSSAQVRAFFTCSVDPSAVPGPGAEGEANLLSFLLERIRAARASIDVAIYSFGDEGGIEALVDALIEAHRRGVRVRLITEDRAGISTGVGRLRAAGLPVSADNVGANDGSGLMHHKFAVFDYLTPDPLDDWVLLGSWNWTRQQTWTDCQNVLWVQDQALAAVFVQEFEEMWGSSGPVPDPEQARFAVRKRDNTPHRLRVGSRRVEVYFSPSDSTARALGRLLAGTERALYVAMSTFTHGGLANTLLERLRAGVDVRVILDNPTATGSQYGFLQAGGVETRVWPFSPGRLLHHKYAILDNRVVVTGSFNWTFSADRRNDEHLVVFFDTDLASMFLQEWAARYREVGGSRPLTWLGSSPDPGPDLHGPRLFPQPADADGVMVAWDYEGPVHVDIYSITGRRLWSATFRALAPRWRLPFPKLLPGVYGITFSTPTGMWRRLLWVRF